MVYHGRLTLLFYIDLKAKLDRGAIPFRFANTLVLPHCFESESGCVWLVNVTNLFGEHGTFTMVIL